MKKNNRISHNSVKDILIVNVHSSENAGDFALLVQTIHYLEKSFGEVNINILANWPNEKPMINLGKKIIGAPWWVIKVWDKNKRPRFQVLSFIIGIIWLFIFRVDLFNLFQKIIPREWLAIFNVYKNTDLVIAVSGNQLFSSGRFGWPITVVGFPIYLARLFRKKIIIFPQSIGPLKSNFDRHLVRFLYDNVDKLFIRDLESLDLVSDLKIKKSQPSFMHDVAFTFPPENPKIAEDILASVGYDKSKKNIGMTIISSMPSYLSSKVMRNYYDSFAEMMQRLIQDEGFEVYLFCQVSGPTDDENDFIGIEHVRKLLPDHINEKIHFTNKKLSPSELKACYGLMNLFIASRLHSGIFSLGMRIPTLFVGYLHKTYGVLNSIHMTEQYIDLEEISCDVLVRKVIKMWHEKRILNNKINVEVKMVEKMLAGFPKELVEAIVNDVN
jgi:colanic acid/amylovoran biosynthesis protein